MQVRIVHCWLLYFSSEPEETKTPDDKGFLSVEEESAAVEASFLP